MAVFGGFLLAFIAALSGLALFLWNWASNSTGRNIQDGRNHELEFIRLLLKLSGFALLIAISCGGVLFGIGLITDEAKALDSLKLDGQTFGNLISLVLTLPIALAGAVVVIVLAKQTLHIEQREEERETVKERHIAQQNLHGIRTTFSNLNLSIKDLINSLNIVRDSGLLNLVEDDKPSPDKSRTLLRTDFDYSRSPSEVIKSYPLAASRFAKVYVGFELKTKSQSDLEDEHAKLIELLADHHYAERKSAFDKLNRSAVHLSIFYSHLKALRLLINDSRKDHVTHLSWCRIAGGHGNDTFSALTEKLKDQGFDFTEQTNRFANSMPFDMVQVVNKLDDIIQRLERLDGDATDAIARNLCRFYSDRTRKIDSSSNEQGNDTFAMPSHSVAVLFDSISDALDGKLAYSPSIDRSDNSGNYSEARCNIATIWLGLIAGWIPDARECDLLNAQDDAEAISKQQKYELGIWDAFRADPGIAICWITKRSSSLDEMEALINESIEDEEQTSALTRKKRALECLTFELAKLREASSEL